MNIDLNECNFSEIKRSEAEKIFGKYLDKKFNFIGVDSDNLAFAYPGKPKIVLSENTFNFVNENYCDTNMYLGVYQNVGLIKIID